MPSRSAAVLTAMAKTMVFANVAVPWMARSDSIWRSVKAY